MGSPGGSHRSCRSSLLWRLGALILILNACHVPLMINAKQITSLDDDLDFVERDNVILDREKRHDVLDDWNPIDEDDEPQLVEGNWFSQGVHRVRRELSRIFGSGTEASKVRVHRSLNKRQQERRQHAKEEAKQRRDLQKLNRQQQQEKQRLQKLQSRKRSPDNYEENYPGSGDGGDGGDETTSYRTVFSINEPFFSEYEDKNSEKFDTLQRQLAQELLSFFREVYELDDDDVELHSTLLHVEPTDDAFKQRVLVQLEIPNRITDFEDQFRKQLSNYNRIGRIGASVDDRFAFYPYHETQINVGYDLPHIANDTIPEVEGSGDDVAVKVSSYGCRGDTTYTCPVSGHTICDEQRCDDIRDCPDNEDELNCESTNYEPDLICSEEEFKCDNRCLRLTFRCDGHTDCQDDTDEAGCPPKEEQEPNPEPEVKADENWIDNVCQANEFRCHNGECISSDKRCDNVNDCSEGEDENEDCGCAAGQFRCRDGHCIPQEAVCDNYAQCPDGSDEADCHTGECLSNQFRCRNGQCVGAAARCNRQTDCLDGSDEQNCANEPANNPRNQLLLKTYPDSQSIKERYIREGREVVFRCRDEGPARAKVRWSRPGGRPLPVGFTDKNGRLEIPNIRVEDAGTYVCEAVGFPNYMPGQQVTVHLEVERYNNVERPPTACTEHQATCMNGDCIDKRNICDGTLHCSDGSDEHSCSHGRKCQPNQFLCHNSKCVERTWRCDGENDCGDNSDEESCDTEASDTPCRFNEFQCRSGHCIPKSFQCDDVPDCNDGSDETGCMAPVPVRPPPPVKSLLEGESLELICTATGTPVPTIVWRLNWGHVPDKCTSTSHEGTGKLYCPNMLLKDSGAYSCEIINTRGTHFVTPDTIVKVTPERNNFCAAGFFNMLARSAEDCISCFCFGVANSCDSANLFTYAIQPPILSHRVVSVELSPYRQLVINEASGQDLLSLHHGVQFRASNVQYGGRETPYLALPSDYMGNQLKSYGGNLKYEVSYVGSGRPVSGPDVIITGNRFTLTHRVRTQPGLSNKVSVSLLPGGWQKPDGRKATREEIMMILANVDNILIRLGYLDSVEREVELVNISLDSAGTSDQGLGSASLVEKCNCPPGYIGDSCESCAPGYVREPGGPWLGHCVPFTPEPCAAGTYGDPRRGIPCRDCPCPLSGSNNFASGCKLSPDGEVICNCYEGYVGRRCESCASGYQGTPMAPGGSCHRIPESTCNVEGTYSARADGSCHCKDLVIGEHCDSCAPKSFHLNSFTYTGCIECFCSGLGADCASTSWFREQISSSFGRTHVAHGFQLVRDYTRLNPQTLQIQTSPSAISFSSSSSEHSGSDTLYWSLPAIFLGNKLTSYGGRLSYNLSYSPLPGGQMSRNSAPDVVIKSGEDLTLIHYRKSVVSPSTANSYAVPVIESAWQRSDGQLANREHLLMALSDIRAIYIKATYTTSTKEGSLQQVVLDTATATTSGTQRAYEVEECRCPTGYKGLSCERCAPGYKRNPEEGLYLGLCEPCECNGHSSQCDAETGECLNCADNTEGESCERCSAGYVGDARQGSPYDCQPDGDYAPAPGPGPNPDGRTDCSHYNCNQYGTSSCDNGYCVCKQNVIGDHCDQCRPGTFGLSANHADGCKECFCSGQSTQCNSAVLYRELIPVDFIDNAPLITDANGEIQAHENIEFDVKENLYTYSHESFLPKYWSLRGNLLGNHLHSYGGTLTYLLIVESNSGRYEEGHDVILIGNGVKLIWSRPSHEAEETQYTVRLHEDDDWQRQERGRSVQASRSDFMNVLTNLEHILIRATPKVPTTRTSIGNVVLETAVEQRTAQAIRATDIELCQCPPGYQGNSCENCAPLHYRDVQGSCRVCPCQRENSESCALGSNGYVECRCKPRYTGDRCQNVDNGIVEPPVPQPDDGDIHTQIIVLIARPEITIVPVGGSLTLTCSGRMRWNNDSVGVQWYKDNSQLPSQASVEGGRLHLYNLQISDSGIYICQARNEETFKEYKDTVSITITEVEQQSPARIVYLPSYVNFEEFQPNEINCEVEGNPTPSVTWTRVDGQADGLTRTDGTRLIFDSPRKSNEGRYRCLAYNKLNQEEKYVQVYVQSSTPPPPPQRERVYIQPEEFNGIVGDTVRLTCQSTGSAKLRYQWAHDGFPLQSQRNIYISDNILEISQASFDDSGKYTCSGVDMYSRRIDADAHVYIDHSQVPPIDGSTSPVITPINQQYIILQGEDFSIACEASGTPYPSIKWTKVHEPLAENVHVSGNVLRIINARPENRGPYTCIAENKHGSDTANTNIDVEPREPPSIEISPTEPQVVHVGTQHALYCRTTGGIPEPTVQWRRVDGTPLSPRHQEQAHDPGYIIIDDIQIADAGDYECSAANVMGSVKLTATVRVVETPVISLTPDDSIIYLTEGDELRISCQASGHPNPNVQWDSRDATPELYSNRVSNSAYLNIYRVSASDARVYVCTATNEAGTDERQIRVEVKPKRGDIPEDDGDVVINQPYPHRPTVAPPRQPPQSEPTKSYATPGDNVTLTCDRVGSYDINVQWVRVDGRPLPPNVFIDRSNLTIIAVEEQNLGQYRCDFFDSRNTLVNYEVRELVMLALPKITFYPNIPLEIEAYQNLDLYCQAENARPEDVHWSADNNRPLSSSVRIDGSVLRFTSITEADAGGYRCSAFNEFGSIEKIAQVKVNPRRTYHQRPKSEDHIGNVGDTVQFRCLVNKRGEVRYNVQYRWYREDQQPLPNDVSPTNAVLVLKSLKREDEGRYVCTSYDVSTRQYLEPTYINLSVQPIPGSNYPTYLPPVAVATPSPIPNRAHDYSLNLNQQSSNLRPGESTEVECYSSDDTYSDVIWERADGLPLTDNVQQVGNRLIISDVNAADAGSYVCKCKTDEGDLYTTTYELAVDEQPHELKRPKIVHAQVGDGALLQCGADDSRSPQRRWSRQYGQLQPGRDLVSEHLSLDDVQSNDAGTYICTATYSDGESVDYPSILVVTGAIPHFDQTPLSYMSFPTLPDSSFKFNFELTFRPESENGILLFNGQTRGPGDYIALSLKDRFAEFRFDFGGKPMVIRSEEPVQLNEWHTVRVHRSRRDGYMQLDEQHPVAFPTLSQTPPLDLIEDLYIAGMPSWELLPEEAVSGERTGFVGCISRLSLQGRTIELMKDAKFKVGVTSCKPCAENPCANSGICLESQTELAYTCVCQQGWTGRNCAVEGTQCTPGICGAGRCENTDMDMECLCPLNRTGDRCQYIEHLNEQSLNFKRNSYAAYGTPRGNRVNITLSVRPSSLRDAVLLYAAESKLPSGDYMALILRDGHVELIINTAARLKPVVIRSADPLPLHRWTRIEMQRRLGESFLRVGNAAEKRAKASGAPRALSLKTWLYVGGYDRATVKINRDINITDGFDGCISRLNDAPRTIHLLADIQDAANVQNCGELNEIGGDGDNGGNDNVPPPDDNGSGEVDGQEQHQPYTNLPPCSIDPCENGGTCSEVANQAVCSCPLGYTGKECKEYIQVGYNASFQGNGYLEISRNQFDTSIEQAYTAATIVFSTSKPNGLLLWWGQKAGEEYTGQDFIAVAVVDGYVEYALRLDGEEAVIRNNDNRVDDGHRHIAIVKRTDNTAMLEVDRITHSSETRPTIKKEITLPGNVFIGGIPDIAQFTGKRYAHNFTGCIVVVEGDAVGQINLGPSAVNGVNVDTCPVKNESLGGTEPPVV